jgi:hypothetical protein
MTTPAQCDWCGALQGENQVVITGSQVTTNEVPVLPGKPSVVQYALNFAGAESITVRRNVLSSLVVLGITVVICQQCQRRIKAMTALWQRSTRPVLPPLL